MAGETGRGKLEAESNPSVERWEEGEPPPHLLQVHSDFSGAWTAEEAEKVVGTFAPATTVLRQLHVALASHAELQRSSEALEDAIQTGWLEPKQLQGSLAANARAMATIKGFLDACLDSFPTSMRPTRSSHLKAEQVFATPELLEQILLYIPPRELLDTVRINRATMQIFNGSPKLLDKLHLRVQKNGYLSSTITSDFYGLSVAVDDRVTRQMYTEATKDECAINQVPITATFLGCAAVRIGNRCRSMLIAQPPVVRMRVTVSCCAAKHRYLFDNDPWSEPPSRPLLSFFTENGVADREAADAEQDRKDDDKLTQASENDDVLGAKVAQTLEIRCRTGITVGHLHDAVTEIRRCHRKCPHASLHEHAEDGSVMPDVTFAAIINLKKDDPYLFKKHKADVRRRLAMLPSLTDTRGMSS